MKKFIFMLFHLEFFSEIEFLRENNLNFELFFDVCFFMVVFKKNYKLFEFIKAGKFL